MASGVELWSTRQYRFFMELFQWFFIALSVLPFKILEISYLLNPENSDDQAIGDFLILLKENIKADAIIHFSSDSVDRSAASTDLIKHARDLTISAGFKYAYTGGINSPATESTYCANGAMALERQNYFLIKNNLDNGRCADGTAIPGVWK